MPEAAFTPPFETYAEAERYLRLLDWMPADPMREALAQARAAQHRYLECLAGEVPRVGRVHDAVAPGPHGPVPLRLYVPAHATRHGPTVVFIRGGGWWAGTLAAYARTMALVCRLTGFPVLGVDYRLAPEHKFPVQLDEVLASLRWLRGEAGALGLDPQRALLWGESAGATLAVCAAQTRGHAMPAVEGLVLFYGNFAGPGPHTRAYSRWVWEKYLGANGSERLDAAVPLRQDLRRLPACWIGVGDADPLLADSLELARRLEEAAVPCTLRIYPGLPHAFAMLSRFLVPASTALQEAARAARELAGATAHNSPPKEESP